MVIQVNDYRVESDTEVQNYLDKNELLVTWLTRDEFATLTELTKVDVSAEYNAVLEDLKDVEKWLSLDPTNIEQCYGLFCLTKWALIGSDIYHNGLLAPIQFQRCGNRWDPHPGGDRARMILSMLDIWPVPVVIDVKSYFANDLPDVVFEKITTVERLKQVFKNWDESWTFIVPFDFLQKPDDHQAFMCEVLKNFHTSRDFAEVNNHPNVDEFYKTQQRFEIKNSKKLFRDISDNKQRMLDSLIVNTDSVSVGPWTLTKNGDLIWNSDQVWSL